MIKSITKTGTAGAHVRWLVRVDLPKVLQIEQQSFQRCWTEEDFLLCLRQRNCIGMVAELGDKIVGFMIYELHESKLCVLNFAVHPDYRRREVGSRMVAKLVSKLSNHKRTIINLIVRESNLDAQLFFSAMGFRAVRVALNYYEDSGEDGFLMQYHHFVREVTEDDEDVVESGEKKGIS